MDQYDEIFHLAELVVVAHHALVMVESLLILVHDNYYKLIDEHL